jgi:hypothetical protein
MSIELTTASAALVLVFALVGVFSQGFIPRFATRFLARAFPKSDPRREEMLAELYGVPQKERLVWVFEQLERVVMEAIPARITEGQGVTSWVLSVDGKTFRLTASRPLTSRNASVPGAAPERLNAGPDKDDEQTTAASALRPIVW